MYELIFAVQELIFAVQELIFPVQEFRSKSHMPLHAKHKRSTVWRPELDAQALSARETNEVSGSFLQNLKAVFRLFLIRDNVQLLPGSRFYN